MWLQRKAEVSYERYKKKRNIAKRTVCVAKVMQMKGGVGRWLKTSFSFPFLLGTKLADYDKIALPLKMFYNMLYV